MPQTEAIIYTIVEYELNGGNLGPTKFPQRRRATAAISKDGVVLKGCGKLKPRSELFIRSSNFNGTGSFIALAVVERSTKKRTVASWKLLDSDRLQLEEALRYEMEKAA